jgi:hypothetical protein
VNFCQLEGISQGDSIGRVFSVFRSLYGEILRWVNFWFLNLGVPHGKPRTERCHFFSLSAKIELTVNARPWLKRNRTKNPQIQPGASLLMDWGRVEEIKFSVQTQLIAYFISERRGGGEAPPSPPPINFISWGGLSSAIFISFCVHIMCALCKFLPIGGDFTRGLLWQSFL